MEKGAAVLKENHTVRTQSEAEMLKV